MNVIYGIAIFIIIVVSIGVGIYAKSWEALTAIGTFLLAIATFIALWWDRKKERTILERQVAEVIFYPLAKSLSFVIDNLKEGPMRGISTFELASIRSSNIYLYSRIKKRMADKIETFDTDLEKFRNLSAQQTPKLARLISEGVLRTGNKTIQQTTNDFSWSDFSCLIGGKFFHVSFEQLIINNQTLDDAIREAQNAIDISNKKIEEEKINLKSPKAVVIDDNFKNISDALNNPHESIRQRFEETLKLIKDGIQKDGELVNYVGEWQNLYKSAVALKKELESSS